MNPLRFCLLLCLFAACSRIPEERPAPAEPLARAAHFLWSKQAPDGGWHSETHGILRGGGAITPFVLDVLLQVPPERYTPHPKQVAAALDFVRNHINAAGIAGLSDPDVMEYPHYATAYSLRALIRHGNPADQPLIRRMAAYLAGQQLAEGRGIAPDHPAYGGWGFGEQGLPPGQSGHVDLSHTRKVIEALRLANWEGDTTFRRVETFLSLLQKRPEDPRPQPNLRMREAGAGRYDGGFYFSSVVGVANKGKEMPASDTLAAHFRSYATATCDGVLALLAAGIPPQDPKIRDAMDWLRAHPRWDRPEGIDPEDPDQWHRVLHYYHLWLRSEVYRQMGEGEGGWQAAVDAMLLAEQREEGSFVNPDGARNKEDDPLLATAMALRAWLNVRADSIR